MGQRIDIANDYDHEMKSSSSTPVTNDDDEEEKEKHDAMKRERARRGEEIRTELRSMGASDLLGMIFRAQQERVATYKLFEEWVKQKASSLCFLLLSFLSRDFFMCD